MRELGLGLVFSRFDENGLAIMVFYGLTLI